MGLGNSTDQQPSNLLETRQLDYFSELPQDLKLYILSNLRVKDLYCLASVNSKWKKCVDNDIHHACSTMLICEEQLWKAVCNKYAPHFTSLELFPHTKPKSWKEACRY